MKLPVKDQDMLHESLSASRLFADWLKGVLKADFLGPEHQDAARELERALQTGPTGPAAGSGPAPLFRSSWVEGWERSISDDLGNNPERDLLLAQMKSLRAGEAEVVVTGQQPGYLGGPLYTLYKVATAIALARKRTALGFPTVPVFWSGDDDSDLAEALYPVAWDPVSGGLHRSPGASAGSGFSGRAVMLGRLAGDPWSADAARWLGQVTSRNQNQADSLPGDLAEMWRAAATDGWSWSRLARRSVSRVFAGSGLVVVSGDDSGLHQAAGPLYQRILANASSLADLASQRGGLLAAGGWHAQISARSLARPLFQVEGDRRAVFESGSQPFNPASLRPGVMFRSPVQDWLLRPAAVVVGPGELAYLRQLDPLYEELGLFRPPLIPRLFAWLVPTGWDPAQLLLLNDPGTGDAERAGRLADEAENQARRILADLLKVELGVDPARALSLAEGRARRWRKGVAAMLHDEIKRSRQEKVPDGPAWVFPGGVRQERRLAYLCALALWGEDLATASLEAAGRHLELGARGDWREFVIEVPEP